MPDADAVIPGKGNLSSAGDRTVLAAFEAKTRELAQLGCYPSGDFNVGWLDCSYCCRIIADVGGLPGPRGYLPPEEVRERFETAKWLVVQPIARGPDPYPPPSEYELHLIAKSFVDLCVKHGLAIEFT